MSAETIRARVLRAFNGVGIRSKIIGMVVVLVGTLGLVAAAFVRDQMRDSLTRELDLRGRAIAEDLAVQSADLILTERWFALHELLVATMRNHPDVRYVFIVGGDGRPLAHTFARGVPADLLTLGGPAAGTTATLVRPLDSDEGVLTDVAAPMLGSGVGVVRVGLLHARLRATVVAGTWRVIGLTGTALVVALAVTVFLTGVLVRPLEELVEATRAVGHGDLSVRVHRIAGDEVGTLGAAVNAMIDNLARSRRDLVRRVRELGALGATSVAVSGSLSVTEMLQAALSRVLDVMETRAGWIFLADGESQALDLVASVGVSAAFIEAERCLDRTKCACREVLRTGRAAVAQDVSGRCGGAGAAALAIDGLAGHASVPIVARDRVLGVLNVACDGSQRFSTEDLSLLDSVGRQMGLAVDNARLWEEVKRKDILRSQLLSQTIAAQESERKRIARELHDEAGQLLTTVLLRLRTLEQEASSPTAVADTVVDLRELTRQLYDEIHRLAVELRPNLLDQLGLVGALESFVREFGSRAGLDATFEASGFDTEEIPPAIEITLYRVVQEALANVAKHAQASRVAVLLERRHGSLVAVVEDDGRGFDLDPAPGGDPGRPKLGLFGMQERAALINARLTIDSAPGHGTTVFVDAPLASGCST